MTVRVLLADDQEMVRAALRVVIDRRDGLAVVGEAADGAEAVAEAARLRPDVVVMDVRMPGMTGVEATRRIMAGPWEGGARPRVLVLTTFDLDEYVYAALRAGASGFLLKNSPIDQLEHAIRVVAAGEAMLAPSVTRRLVTAFAAAPPAPEPPASEQRAPGRLDGLTGRESEVLLLVARGLANARIAELLGLSEANVKSRVNRILARLGLENRVQAAILAYKEDLPGLRDGAGPPG
ncbi:response regulator transcription factor [Actinomadura violacea]|uniref:Response regulator transcription factor n=1 Tax=Actinomadura violacea TaxID=2819934 RepID=A0ABS3S9X8_9ACTN|nr:response regulator transcription factor [Actinomadura violacea]MBO2465808.1 response regulator transcription factor [Actinomadura violacea]